MVEGVMNDLEVDLNPQKLLEKHINQLYCKFDPPHRVEIGFKIRFREQDIIEAAANFRAAPGEMML